ncbi:hypothetical protein [Pantoea agglomerans]|uniref:hypothetical protein n=1 Tax=Enterobacter agglomerans TaxID=549 RepID=UPI00109430C8|nr:hypothetical protein [Pantoea agglomerans]TGX94261.1 hypothetical protein E5821_07340 [Pantoea agglomerans]
MKDRIYDALRSLHKGYETQAQASIPYFGLPISVVVKEMGMSSEDIGPSFYDALEELQAEGLIWDESTSNGAFGKYIGGDGSVSYSLGAKIRLAH